jgi:hypothetical protein
MATELEAARLMVARGGKLDADAPDKTRADATDAAAPWPSASPPMPASRSATRRCSCTAATATSGTSARARADLVRDLRVHQILEGRPTRSCAPTIHPTVMAGLDPAIQVLVGGGTRDLDARIQSGHDGSDKFVGYSPV